MSFKPLSASVLALLGPVVALQAYAEIYMSEADAVRSLLGDEKATAREYELAPAEIAKIEGAQKEKVRSSKLKIWKNSKGYVFVDQVLGKHEFITYALAVNPAGKVFGMEILEYRESYGSQVRKPEWKSQFNGKDVSAELKLDKDIKNISGATLSSAHVTAGVKRLLQTYDIIHARL